jgi:hypothetical protein
MRIHHIAAVVVLGVLIVIATSCSKMTPHEAAEVRKSFGLPADMPLKDLGAVELRVGTPNACVLGRMRIAPLRPQRRRTELFGSVFYTSPTAKSLMV